MKLIKWTCECGEPLPDYTGYEYVICEKCGAKYRVESEQSDYLSPPYHITYMIQPGVRSPYTWRLGDQYSSSSSDSYWCK